MKHEQDASDQPRPKQELISLLSKDFTPPERQAALDDSNALSRFLAIARVKEDIEERTASDECAQLAASAAQALETAPITDSFKGIITGHLVRAYAWESAVDDSVSSDRLGLLSGDGIFDAAEAKIIEAQALRGFLFDIVNNQVLLPDDEGELEEAGPIIPNPALYVQLMEAFDSWALDYLTAYSEDAFAGIEPEAYLDAAKRVRIIPREESEEIGWAEMIERLRELKQKQETDD